MYLEIHRSLSEKSITISNSALPPSFIFSSQPSNPSRSFDKRINCSALGKDKPFSRFDTVCRTTYNSFDISPCDKPLCFRRSFKFDPNITFTSCYIFYHRYRKKSKQRILTFRVNPHPAAPRHGPVNLLRRPRKNQPPLPPPAYMIPQNPTQKALSERIPTAPSTNTLIPYGTNINQIHFIDLTNNHQRQIYDRSHTNRQPQRNQARNRLDPDQNPIHHT